MCVWQFSHRSIVIISASIIMPVAFPLVLIKVFYVYRETALLVDPENTSAVSKQWIALVVGHELAHQWFGNLVTMEWWTHLWLNEGQSNSVH